jgi:hypothetical protein
MSGCLDRIGQAANQHEHPVDRFWAAIRTYLEIFAERPKAAFLWFSYWVDVGQKARLEPIDRMHQMMAGVLREAKRPYRSGPARKSRDFPKPAQSRQEGQIHTMATRGGRSPACWCCRQPHPHGA